MTAEDIVKKANELLYEANELRGNPANAGKIASNIKLAHRLLSEVSGFGRMDFFARTGRKWNDLCREYSERVNTPILNLEEVGAVSRAESDFYSRLAGPFPNSFTYDDCKRSLGIR